MKYKENEVIELSAVELAKRDTPEAVEGYILEQADTAKLKSGTVIDWKQKLSSRKLWAALVGVIVGIAAAFGITENEYAQIVGVVGSVVSVMSYIFGESAVDAARATGSAKVDAAKELTDVWFHNDTGDGGDSVLK